MSADPPTPALELVSRLASGVAHDLSNLLTVIAGRCALAAERVGPDEPLRRDLEMIRETAARAVDLAEQLRAFARRQRLDLRAADLNELLRQMDGPLRRVLGDRIDLIIDTGAAPADAAVDPGLLGQALAYLASVARDGMAGEGRFTVATAGPVVRARAVGPGQGPWLRIRVSDTGPSFVGPPWGLPPRRRRARSSLRAVRDARRAGRGGPGFASPPPSGSSSSSAGSSSWRPRRAARPRSRSIFPRSRRESHPSLRQRSRRRWGRGLAA